MPRLKGSADLLEDRRKRALALLVSRFRKFGQRDKWKGCSPTAIKMAEMRSNDDATSTPEPHIGL